MSTLFIIGAGTDKGLGMPLANDLIPELIKFTEQEGMSRPIIFSPKSPV